MRRLNTCSFVANRWRRQNGVAIILSLGILSLVLILAMSYAYNSQTNHQIASVSNDQVVARIMAEAAVSRSISLLRELNEHVVTRQAFYQPTGAMRGRPYLVSQNPDGIPDATDSAAQALAINYNGYDYVSETNLLAETGYTSDVGWIYQTTLSDNTSDGSATDSDVKVLSRIAYAIFDESGKVDPGQIIDSAGEWAEGTEIGTGTSMAELNLKYVLACQRNDTLSPSAAADMAENFQVDGLGQGQLKKRQIWHSHYDIFNTIRGIRNQTLADTVSTLLLPYSTTDNGGKYWNDINDDSMIDHETEIHNKFDVHNVGVSTGPTITATELYDAFVGYDADTNPGRDNASYFSTWLRSLSIPGANAAAIRERKRVIAAQAAANIVDYGDSNSVPGRYYLADSNDGYALTTTSGVNNQYAITGIEDVYMVGEVIVYIDFLRDTGDPRTLHIGPYAQVELLRPFTEDDNISVNFSGTVSIDYEFSATFPTGTHTEAASVDGGTMVGSGASYHVDVSNGGRIAIVRTGGTKTIYSNAFVDGNPANIQINYFRIKGITVSDGTNVLDALPDEDGMTLYQYDLGSAPLTIANGETRFGYLHLHWTDPRLNGHHSTHADFNDFIYAFSNSGGTYFATEAACDNDAGADFGVALNADRDHTWRVRSRKQSSENDANYGDSWVGNTNGFTRTAELGRVSSPHTPCRSLRFWTYQESDLDGRIDSYLLDMFSDYKDDLIRGRININTQHSSVLRAALLNTTVTNPNGVDDVILDILYANGSRGDGSVPPFAGIGALGYIPNIQADTDIQAYEDYDAEIRITSNSENGKLARLYPLVTVGQEYFTIVACAQTLRDIGKWTPGTAPETSGRPIPWKQSGAQYHYAVKQSEQKIVAVIARDVFCDTYKVLGYEYVD